MIALDDRAAIRDAANVLGVPYYWLFKIINFESGFNPTAKNPTSSAAGLIQFIDSTAQDLGYLSANDLITKLPTIRDQLAGAVVPYLKKYAPFPTQQSLYMSIFYPAARNWPPDKEFPAWVQDANRSLGIKTVSDYMRLVDIQYVKPYLKLLAFSVTALYLLYATFKLSKG